MDRFEAMSVLLAVVEAGSLSGAGRRLGVPLPTISRKISELETHLNARLLIRSSRHLTLTEAGRSYVAACKNILEDVAEAERAATGEYSTPKGELVITAPIVFGRLHVLPIVIAFLSEHPNIDVKLMLADRVVHLQEDHIDMGVRIGALPDSSLVATKVGVIRRVVCGSPSYIAKHGVPKSPDDLALHQCVTFTGLTSADSWSFKEGALERAIAIRSRLAVNTAEAAIDAAIAGLGVTRVLSYQVSAALDSGQLVEVLQNFAPETLPVNLLYSSQGLLPLKLRAFLDFAGPRLKSAMSLLST